MEAGQGAPKVDMADPSEDVQPEKESTSRISRSAVIAFCLVAGLTYRASVSLVPAGIAEDGFVLGLAGLLLVLAMLSRRAQRLRRFWEIPFAFFVFTIAGFAPWSFAAAEVATGLIMTAVSWAVLLVVTGALYGLPMVHHPLATAAGLNVSR